jgi:hypothetical protein
MIGSFLLPLAQVTVTDGARR